MRALVKCICLLCKTLRSPVNHQHKYSLRQETNRGLGNHPNCASLLEKLEVIKIKDIMDTALASDSFTTLCKAVTTAGLVKTLRSKGPFMRAGTVDALLKR